MKAVGYELSSKCKSPDFPKGSEKKKKVRIRSPDRWKESRGPIKTGSFDWRE